MIVKCSIPHLQFFNQDNLYIFVGIYVSVTTFPSLTAVLGQMFLECVILHWMDVLQIDIIPTIYNRWT